MDFDSVMEFTYTASSLAVCLSVSEHMEGLLDSVSGTVICLPGMYSAMTLN